MRRALVTGLCNILLLASVSAQNGGSTTQSVTMEVKAITKIAVSGNPGALTINDFIAGVEQAVVTDANTNYSVTTNLENMKIVASINLQMPTGTKLMVSLASGRGMSAGTVDLSNALSPVNVITGIRKGSEANQRITYLFAANASVGEIQQESRTITLTLTD